jgi:hypothetical protein
MAKTVHSGSDKFIVSDHEDLEIDFNSMYEEEIPNTLPKLLNLDPAKSEKQEEVAANSNLPIVSLVFQTSDSSTFELSGILSEIKDKMSSNGVKKLRIKCLAMTPIAITLRESFFNNPILTKVSIYHGDNAKHFETNLLLREQHMHFKYDEIAECNLSFISIKKD